MDKLLTLVFFGGWLVIIYGISIEDPVLMSVGLLMIVFSLLLRIMNWLERS